LIQSVEKYSYDRILVDIDITLPDAVGVPIGFPGYEPARSNQGILSNFGDVKKLWKVDVEFFFL